MDIGYNRKTGIASMVEYLRETDQMGLATKIRGMTFKKYIKSNTIECIGPETISFKNILERLLNLIKQYLRKLIIEKLRVTMYLEMSNL